MTAPLIMKNIRTEEKATLRTSAHGLLDAIDNSNVEEVEVCISQILDGSVPEVSIHLFYNYAQAKGKTKVCEYLRLVLIATYNTTR